MENKKILVNLFQAYYDARKNKRNTQNQLNFEFNLESNIIELRQELISGKYEVGRSVYFIQNNPVKREVFAGDFRDRIVHHLIYNYISPIFEKEFIYDSYSCREGKGTSFGIKRLSKFIRTSSKNYTKDAYILKLDISGYFMSINKDILYKKIEKTLQCNYRSGPDNLGNCHIRAGHEYLVNRSPGQARRGQVDYDFLLDLIEKNIFNNPKKNAIFKGNKSDYLGLPKNKSLFFAPDGYGLPI